MSNQRVYQCTMCYQMSQDPKYKGDNTRCDCGKGFMRKIDTTVYRKESPKKEVECCNLVTCTSCGRDTTARDGVCHICRRGRVSPFVANSENKGRKFLKIDNAPKGVGLE
jgi:hypothetical protein